MSGSDAGAAAPPPVAENRWTAVPTAASQARHFLRDQARGWQLPAELTEVAVLLTSELVTNSLTHGEGTVNLRAYRLAGGGVRVEVDDDGPGVPRVRRPDPDNEHGRGMALVDMLAAGWGWTPLPGGGKTVWFELRPDGDGQRPGSAG
ncbi:MAG: ATP-binding protein [Mycobacterium sp.]|jgi:anti-sigma regulatory factor (Ser/Thr protein kinase)|nr:ATP-binding protein [Mycobacterium sp.]